MSAADETRSDGGSGRRVVVASSVMSDERAPRSSAPLTAKLVTQCNYVLSVFNLVPFLSVWFIIHWF